MTLPADALRACKHCAAIADSVLPAGDPRRQWLPRLQDLLADEISKSRAGPRTAVGTGQLPHEPITAPEAAAIIGVSRRHLLRLAADDDLGAQNIGGRWLFPRTAVEQYAQHRKDLTV